MSYSTLILSLLFLVLSSIPHSFCVYEDGCFYDDPENCRSDALFPHAKDKSACDANVVGVNIFCIFHCFFDCTNKCRDAFGVISIRPPLGAVRRDIVYPIIRNVNPVQLLHLLYNVVAIMVALWPATITSVVSPRESVVAWISVVMVLAVGTIMLQGITNA